VSTEEKWKMNAKKVAFAKAFPGRLQHWHETIGKKIKQVIELEKEKMEVILFSDATFIVIPNPNAKPALLLQALRAAMPVLRQHYEAAYKTLDDFIASDQELQRKARLDNIMGAIHNNYPKIPELKVELRRFLEEIE